MRARILHATKLRKVGRLVEMLLQISVVPLLRAVVVDLVNKKARLQHPSLPKTRGKVGDGLPGFRVG